LELSNKKTPALVGVFLLGFAGVGVDQERQVGDEIAHLLPVLRDGLAAQGYLDAEIDNFGKGGHRVAHDQITLPGHGFRAEITAMLMTGEAALA
jgi:hypothetical protein